MPSGTFRRPPQLWEQKLASLVSINNVGTIAGGATDGVGSDLPPGDGGGGGSEPEPVQPSPVAFGTPSTPTLTGGVQSIMVTWDGLTSGGELYPYETAVVEIHLSTSTGFTPDATTLKGSMRYPGVFTLTGLSAGTTYYVKLRGRDAKGNYSTASAQASGQTGLTTSSDYGTATINSGAVSFNARSIGGITTTVGTSAPSSPVTGDIWLDSTGGSIVHKRWSGSAWITQAWGSDSLSANCITSTQVAAGAITAGAISAGAVTAAKISSDAIDGKTITGATLRTSSTAGSSGAGVVMDTSGIRGYNASVAETFNLNASTGALTITGNFRTGLSGARVEIGSAFSALSSVQLFSSSGSAGAIFTDLNNGVTFTSSTGVKTTIGNSTGGTDLYGPTACKSTLAVDSTSSFTGKITASGGIDTSSSQAVDMQGVYDNNTTGLAPLGITTTGRLRRNGTSTQRIKYDIATLSGQLSGSVDTARLANVTTCDPFAILDVAVVEFSVIDEGLPTERRLLGVIAEDVDDKLPIAVYREADGSPGGVNDQAMISALLAVVQQQQQTIQDLTARVEALEAK